MCFKVQVFENNSILCVQTIKMWICENGDVKRMHIIC